MNRTEKLQSLKQDEILGDNMGEEAVCDYPGCGSVGEIISRLSPEGYLVATGKKAYSFREAYRRFYYCANCHEKLMGGVWSRVRKPDDKSDGHVAPTAI
jgi:hypothetical protein